MPKKQSIHRTLHRPKSDQKLLRTLGAAARHHREKLGVSQEFIAREAGWQRPYLTEIETGVRNISLSNLLRLAQALRISLPTLMRTVETIIPPGEPWCKPQGLPDAIR